MKKKEAWMIKHATWDEFSSAVMGLSSQEAFFVAHMVEGLGVSVLHKRRVPPRREPTQDLPELLMNYAFAKENSDGKVFNLKRASEAIKLICGARLKDMNGYVDKLRSRVEFQSMDRQLEMPKVGGDIFEKAFSDAEEGSEKGLAWACFGLRETFRGSTDWGMDQDEALDLYESLRGVPDIIIDTYGEAGFDVAMRMEKMLNKIGQMPILPQQSTFQNEMRAQI